MRLFLWFSNTVGATNNTTNLDLLSKQTSTKTPKRRCKPQTSSQITDYCGVQKRKREDVRQVRKSRFSSGLEKQKKKFFFFFATIVGVPVFILGAALLLGTHYSKSHIFVQKTNFDKTPTFSRVFHPNFFWQLFSWNQSCQQLKSPKSQHFHEFFTQKIDNFLGKSKLNFWTENGDFEQCVEM